MTEYNAAQQSAQKTARQTAREFSLKAAVPRCAQCGASLEEADMFCTECGAKVEGTTPQVMNADDTARLAAEFAKIEENASAEFKAFQKRLVERQILLEERGYFHKREKDIAQTFGSRPFAFESLDPEEEAFRKKAYGALEKTLIEQQEKVLEEELNRRFPEAETQAERDEKKHLAEIAAQKTAMEQHFQSLLAQVENEVDEFRREQERQRLEAVRQEQEAEQRRLREEQRQAERALAQAAAVQEAEREAERERLQQEARENRIVGTYYYSDKLVELTLQFPSKEKAIAKDYFKTSRDSVYSEYRISSDGFAVLFQEVQSSHPGCLKSTFEGTINDAGTEITGCWSEGDMYDPQMTYYKTLGDKKHGRNKKH